MGMSCGLFLPLCRLPVADLFDTSLSCLTPANILSSLGLTFLVQVLVKQCLR